MAGDVIYEAPRRSAAKMRVHDYLYDSAFIVSSARDFARMAFKAAMASAQLTIQPVYETMFSESRQYPSVQVVYHPNCRLPAHVDRSYAAHRQRATTRAPPAQPATHTYKYTAMPKKVLPVKSASPDFQPPRPPSPPRHNKPISRGTQSVYRESSAQTRPWQPDSKVAEGCGETPEVLYLENMEWGPGIPYRTGDLPADFHTTEIINKMRHARKWSELVEKGQAPGWLKKRNAIIADIETKDYIFREAEIDELQEIRLSILHKMQAQHRLQQTNRTSMKLAELWTRKKREMERKIESIRRNRDRELRKLSQSHSGAKRLEALRDARGARAAIGAAADRSSSTHAPLARHGVQARHRHARLTYDLSLLELEDHEKLMSTPPWLEQCLQLKRTWSGHERPRDQHQLCERETKWSEDFLETLHNDLKKARLGAAVVSAGPLHILKPRVIPAPPCVETPEVEGIPDEEELSHQSALVLQKIIRGRAVQNLMVEGRTRAAELMQELKTTHGLQQEDKERIEAEAVRARDYRITRTAAEQKEEAISALVEELCGGAVSAALDFLEKELRRLKEERRQHAYILIALREKTLREAAEAGRRQKEVQRRREHDEIFKQVVGVTQETVDLYLRDVIREGVELAAEEDAVRRARDAADAVEQTLEKHGSMSTAEQCDAVADLVHNFLLPESQRAAARLRLSALQATRMESVRKEIFGAMDEDDVKKDPCTVCGDVPGGCRCRACDGGVPRAVATTARDDPRWKFARRRPVTERSYDERFPPAFEMAAIANALVDNAVRLSHIHREERCRVAAELGRLLRDAVEVRLDTATVIEHAISVATGEVQLPVKQPKYHFVIRSAYYDAAERERPPQVEMNPRELPSDIRRRQLEEAERAKPKDETCRCSDDADTIYEIDTLTAERRRALLPSELRRLEELKRCKCDAAPTPPNSELDIAPLVGPEASTPSDSTVTTEGTTGLTAADTQETQGLNEHDDLEH
ncbi:cilia- and flagella-associated protein 91-like isoform X2 [Aricia agestis]|uniref:cilia- and flagella-associated protein 91-like isoform X2 n=1 Tax=Aricia agestis TaxID=91739 RepID=UPI001C201B8D|nr:cilia- and flagella-associated protein 91-like isoform X2 [Aricia agestis]